MLYQFLTKLQFSLIKQKNNKKNKTNPHLRANFTKLGVRIC